MTKRVNILVDENNNLRKQLNKHMDLNIKYNISEHNHKISQNKIDKNKFLNHAEYRLVIGPLFNFSKSEYESAIHKLNQETEETTEQFYSYKNNDYEL